MTALQLLEVVREKDIQLEVDGDRLFLRAADGAVTPELRAALSAHKPAFLALLDPERFVTLKGGLTVPAAALTLMMDLEARGLPLAVDANHDFVIPCDERLTHADRAVIRRWRAHLGALVEYEVPAVEQPV